MSDSKLVPAAMSTRARKSRQLTTPDLVLLSLLAERPMHGYEANAELERRQVRDWAGISRPQIYYSLDKLAARRLIREVPSRHASAGPDKRVFATTRQGTAELARALSAPSWAMERGHPLFLTWLALSWKAEPGAFGRQLERRVEFVSGERTRAQSTLRDVLAEVGHPYHEAVWMLSLVIAQAETELRWLETLGKEAPRRRPAERPASPMALPKTVPQ